MKNRTGGWVTSLATALAALVFLLPFYICVVTAFKTAEESAASTLALPGSLYLENFVVAMEKSNFSQSFFNSLTVTAISAACIVLLSAMCGYVICRNLKSRFYRAMNTLMFVGIMIPFQVIMIPVYRMFKGMELLNTFTGVILLMIGTSIPYATYLVVGFVKSVPVQLEEAARIDGCSVFRTFWQIVFPLLKPITGTVGILHVLWMWNEFNMSFIVLQQDAVRTLPVQQYHFFGQFSVNLNLGFASACITLVPVILFFLFAQRFLIGGVTSGAVKG